MSLARFRKKFAYPIDDTEDDQIPNDLDEEEQEQLIQKLKDAESRTNEEYKRLFLTVPIVSALAFLPTLLMSDLFQPRVIAILSISSLICSAYILLFVPNLKPSGGSNQPRGLADNVDSGPLQLYLVPMNGILSSLLGFNAITFQGTQGVHDGFWVLCLMPSGIFLLILVARRIMFNVDIGELERARYTLKGA